MILAAPFMMLGLLVLPALWWLLRALPPAPRTQRFPAIRLLEGLQARTREARRAPPWLLALRIAAAFLLVLGLAQPVLVQDGAAMSGAGTLLLVIDDGWASAPDWSARMQAARETLDRAARAGRRARLLMTARDGDGMPVRVGPAVAAGLLGSRLDEARTMPWPVDRLGAAHAIRTADAGDVGGVIYLSDGLAAPGDREFRAALHAVGPVTELRAGLGGLAVLGRPASVSGRLVARIITLPQPMPRVMTLRGETRQGATLARLDVDVPAGASTTEAAFALPSELRNQLSRLVLNSLPGAGGVRLLDEGDRRRPVGLLASGGGDTPLLGTLFYLRRGLAPTSELREGTPDALLSRRLSVLIAPDGTLDEPADRKRVAAWIRQGGMLIRFAGPRLAAMQADAQTGPPVADDDPDAAGPVSTSSASSSSASTGQSRDADDSLLPVKLLVGARELGGTMSWGHPEHPAPFPAESPFAGLVVPDEVTISRQVLAQPSADLDTRSWARLSDGTPLVTHAPLGDGQIVLFHVTSTADWSNLPLSGLFPQMLERLVQQAAGLSSPGDHAVLAPVETLDGDGVLGVPPPSAHGLAADAFGTTPASPAHPAGLYGPVASRRSLNLADALPALGVEAPAGELRNLADRVPDRPLGPGLLALALALLALDLLATMQLRGLLHRRLGGASSHLVALGLLAGLACLATNNAIAMDSAGVPQAALETRLAYIVTGDPLVDEVSRQGLEGLSAYANARTSAQLGHPDGVVPGHDDLAFYPMLYWPVTPSTMPASPAAGWTASLNAYMSHGGILLIDTQGSDRAGDADAGFTLYTPGTTAALRRATAGLDIPSLYPVDAKHVLSRSFYLLSAYPGRYAGAPVWVARDDDIGNDGVSPVIIGANDWAAAWATDAGGQTPYAVIPGGESQRVTAYRFGVNAVIYALTGNYKTDQVHVPALLQRLGE